MYTLNEHDYSKFLVFQERNKVHIKRQRVILRWLVCFILLISVPVLHLDSKLYIFMIVGVTFLWIVISGMFMDHVMIRQAKKQICKEHGTPFTEMEVNLIENGLYIKQDEHEYQYAFQDITHIFRFHKLFIITVRSKQTILIPFRAFDSKDEYRYFYVQLMEGCNRKPIDDDIMKEE